MIWRTSSPGRVLRVSRGWAEAVVSMESGSVGQRVMEETGRFSQTNAAGSPAEIRKESGLHARRRPRRQERERYLSEGLGHSRFGQARTVQPRESDSHAGHANPAGQNADVELRNPGNEGRGSQREQS